ncbi:MAG: hypothetical protein EBT86_09590 [Actinobacteria bacterium]|nr:hypothetical protein [Actinomycetota bacterium]
MFLIRRRTISKPAARGNGADSVFSKTGSAKKCGRPIKTSTAQCSSDVLVNGIGVVRLGDMVNLHPRPPCIPDTSTCSKASTSVFANGKGIARIGDQYSSDNIITSGSSNVFIG